MRTNRPENAENRIYVRKSQEKKFLGIKTLLKKPQFSKVLRQNVTGDKVLSIRFLELFITENNMGAANNVSVYKITGIKVLKKKKSRKNKSQTFS